MLNFAVGPVQMEEEIRMFRELGASGVVFGALTPDGDLDMEAMARLMGCAGDMHVTLHRAFDMARDPLDALDFIEQKMLPEFPLGVIRDR